VTAPDSSTSIAYDALRDSLLHAGAVLPLPELHGGICGALCASGPSAARTWIDEGLTGDVAAENADAVRESLHELVAASAATLAGTELDFEPLLPADAAPLEEQVAALASWCHGFLGGLGFAAPDLDVRVLERGTDGDTAAAQVAEICADFAEISRAGLTQEEADAADQAGFALAELREYVRVGAQLVYEELAERRARAAATAPRDLH
jgi:uncharacterized protein YgfB (UPF0149 family)